MILKEFYEHEHSPSVFIMFGKDGTCHWCYSGNELRRIYLESPKEFVSMPIEVPIPDDVNKALDNMYENW